MRTFLLDFVNKEFSEEAKATLIELPTARLSQQPLLDLLEGFEIDLQFSAQDPSKWPINTTMDLLQYGRYVAGTVAELCLDLVFYHHGDSMAIQKQHDLRKAGTYMGQALQTVNISRDIQVDAKMRRVYIPKELLGEHNLDVHDVLTQPDGPQIESLRSTMLETAFELYAQARPSIEDLPPEARSPMRVAVESYMEIGRVLRQRNYRVIQGTATVGKLRRAYLAWTVLSQ